MSMKRRIRWLTQTAVLIALLIATQAFTASMSQLVTGAAVNLILIVAAVACGVWSGLAVAVISPVAAFLVGVGPAMFPLIPFVIAGNATIVLLWSLICGAWKGNAHIARIIAAIVGAVGKFLVLYLGVVKIAVPHLLGFWEAQAKVISAAFSVNQLFTAAIGGALAVVLLPLLTKALKHPAD